MTTQNIPVKQTNSQEILEFPIINVSLLGRQVTFITVPDIVDTIDTACVNKKKIVIANYNVHSFNLSMQIPWFYSFLQNSEIAHCDSVGILKATEWMGLKLPLQYRASYTLLMPKLLEHCDRQRLSIFLLGATPEHSHAAIERLQAQYPNMAISGHHGYFDMQNPDRNNEVLKQISQAKPNILIVGMGMPMQENWIYKNRENIENTNVIMSGGAAIDRLAGVVPDCPAFLSNIGLEWLYRLCREPKRLATRYLVGNLAFILHLILAKSYSPSLSPALEVQSKDNLMN
jgi:N-acetylglucosaminyldiphosphoundecaprenol N-acetyl-beta-D-mannosaminyltransferase